MVAMASDSYLLKMPPPPCQASCRGAVTTRSTSCGVVVALVLVLTAVLALAGMLYYQRMELCSLRADMAAVATRVQDVDNKLNRLHEYESIKAFERASPLQDEDDDDDLGEEDDGDDPDPYYSDIEEDGLLFERRGQAWPARHGSSVGSVVGSSMAPPSAAATALTMLEEADSDSDVDSDSEEPPASPAIPAVAGGPAVAAVAVAAEPDSSGQQQRVRREVAAGSGSSGRGDPQLRLYHMLQSPGSWPGPAAAAVVPSNPPEEAWSRYGRRRDGLDGETRPQVMYAERAPMEFAMPPGTSSAGELAPTRRPLHRHSGTVEVARRQSRVMDTAPNASAAVSQHQRRRQRKLLSRNQRRHQLLWQAASDVHAPDQQGQSRGERVNDTFDQ